MTLLYNALLEAESIANLQSARGTVDVNVISTYILSGSQAQHPTIPLGN